MRARLGIYISVAALILMSYFPIGLVSYALAQGIGDIVAPRKDHILIFLLCLAGFWLFIVLVFVGLLQRRSLALKAALVFIGDLAALGWVDPLAGNSQSWFDRTFGLALAGLCLGGAIYLWRLTWKSSGADHRR